MNASNSSKPVENAPRGADRAPPRAEGGALAIDIESGRGAGVSAAGSRDGLFLGAFLLRTESLSPAALQEAVRDMHMREPDIDPDLREKLMRAERTAEDANRDRVRDAWQARQQSRKPLAIEFARNLVLINLSRSAKAPAPVWAAHYKQADVGRDPLAALRSAVVNDHVRFRATPVELGDAFLCVKIQIWVLQAGIDDAAPASDATEYPALRRLVSLVLASNSPLSEPRIRPRSAGEALAITDAATMAKPAVKLDTKSLYEAIHATATKAAEQPAGLAPKLYTFQRRCLRWMCEREAGRAHTTAALPELEAPGFEAVPPPLHPLWEEFILPQDPSGAVHVQTLYINRFSGRLSRRRFPLPPPPQPGLPGDFDDDAPVPGGILADEMGLGKTVELLALIVAHPRPDLAASVHVHVPAPSSHPAAAGSSSSPLEAPRSKLRCGTTLVVCPDSIVEQWRAEARRHTPDLKVHIYEGVYRRKSRLDPEADAEANLEAEEGGGKEAGGAEGENREGLAQKSSRKGKEPAAIECEGTFISAEELAEYDIILTSYTMLKKELNYGEPAGMANALRKPKRYAFPDSPLLKLDWWRVVLDEAQLALATTTSQAARVALCLSARNRWCATGTPIGEGGLEDLYGLLEFVRHDPYAEKFYYENAICGPYSRSEAAGIARLHALLRSVMWRTVKARVDSETELPPIHRDGLQKLELSIPEREFYERVVQDARKTEDRDAQLHITSLQLACCHPLLTKEYAKTGRTDVRLEAGGFSFANVMERLIEQVGVKLQSIERNLCKALNDLAVTESAPKASESATKKNRRENSRITLKRLTLMDDGRVSNIDGRENIIVVSKLA